MSTDWSLIVDDIRARGGIAKAKLTYQDGEVYDVRLFVSQDSRICVLRKGSRRYGYILPYNVARIDLINEKKKAPEVVWRESWEKVANRLDRSGLWGDMLVDVRTALGVGYEKLQAAHAVYWQNDATTESRVRDITAIDPRLIKSSPETGQPYPDTSILYYMVRPAKVKKMWFGKYRTEDTLAEIALAMKNRVEYKTFEVAGYDVSFHYVPERLQAWYSEEYRDCGNGHYYLALDATHALFYEDD